MVHERQPLPNGRKDKVLIFHPGGYRGVVSSLGDSKEACYMSQKLFIKRVCLPLVDQDLIPVIKVHPLRAKFHDIADLVLLAREVEEEAVIDRNSIQFLDAKDWYWDTAYQSKFILNFGSTSIFELWSAGMKNVYICNFEGKERSRKLDFFKSSVLETYHEYVNFVKNADRHEPKLDPFTKEVMSTYHALFEGRSVAHTTGNISSVLGLE